MYPEDQAKPSVGEGLNRRAIVTLEGCWPVCKTTREYIRDPERIASTGYHDKLKRSTEKLGARFLDYSPETGSCSFEVQYVHVVLCVWVLLFICEVFIVISEHAISL